jgi:hypothetical protein
MRHVLTRKSLNDFGMYGSHVKTYPDILSGIYFNSFLVFLVVCRDSLCGELSTFLSLARALFRQVEELSTYTLIN